MIFITNNQAAKVEQPSEGSFYFPATLEAAQWTSVLSDAIAPATLAVWSNHLGAELLQNFVVQAVTVVSFISNESLGKALGEKHWGHISTIDI